MNRATLLIGRSAALCLFLTSVPALGQSEPKASCQQLSLTKSSGSQALGGEAEALYSSMEDFERAFAEKKLEHFNATWHPSVSRKPNEKKEVFDDLIATYGLDHAKLVRNAVFDLQFSEAGEPTVDCSVGALRGVVGPKRQAAVIYTFLGGSEQIRLFTLFAPIPKELVAARKLKHKVGFVFLHAQFWSHEKKSPERLLDDARNWNRLREPLAAWVLAEAARRILVANPYLTPINMAEATNLAAELEKGIADKQGVKDAVATAVPGWEFVDFTTVYQATGIELGVKVRTQNEETIEAQIQKCEKASRAVALKIPGVRHRFRGIECLAFKPTEALNEPPSGGSQFFPWKQLFAK